MRRERPFQELGALAGRGGRAQRGGGGVNILCGNRAPWRAAADVPSEAAAA
jgi:hypothetical protein